MIKWPRIILSVVLILGIVLFPALIASASSGSTYSGADVFLQAPTPRAFVSVNESSDFGRVTPYQTFTGDWIISAAYRSSVPNTTSISNSVYLFNYQLPDYAELEEGFVYKFEFDLSYGDYNGGTSFYPSSLKLAFPFMNNVNASSSYGRSELLAVYPFSFLPSSVVDEGMGFYHLTYNVLIRPELFRDKYSFVDDLLRLQSYTFIDDSGYFDSLWYAWTGNTLRVQLRQTVHSINITYMDPTQAQTEELSQVIETQTNRVISLFTDPLPSASPYPGVSSIIESESVIHDGLESLSEDVVLTFPYSGINSKLSVGTAAFVSNWLQMVYETNDLIFILTTAVLGVFLAVSVYRSVF